MPRKNEHYTPSGAYNNAPLPKVLSFTCTHPDPTPYDIRARLGLSLLVLLGPGTRYIGILQVVHYVGGQPYFSFSSTFSHTSLLSSFWTSRGHRCHPFSPPVLAVNFYRA